MPNKYWPLEFGLDDTKSPMEILSEARSEWESNSGALLTLVLQEAESQSGYDMIIVHAKHVPSNRTASLFSVVCRKGKPYPVRMQPKSDELPNFFKKEYIQSGFGGFSVLGNAVAGMSQDKLVVNEWVSDTPGEFRRDLERVFNLGTIKSEVLNLISLRSADGPSASSSGGGADKEELPASNE